MARGRPGGNPNIAYERKTGPRTKEGKLKALISNGNLKATSKSKVLNAFKCCNLCPLRPKNEKRIVAGKEMMFTTASKCPSYKEGQKCIIPQGEFIDALKFFYKNNGDKLDAIALQEAITYKTLQDAEMCREVEIVQNKRPSFYTHKFMELAANANSTLVKAQTPQKIQAEIKQQTANIDINDLIRMAKEEEDKE